MRKLLICAVFGSFALTANVASARNIWRECGIGGMLFKSTGWAAITSNIIWDLGTTATSSNVSSDDLCEGSSASTASFIHETYANLEEEIAVGQGTHVTAMLNMLGCDSSTHGGIISGLRSDLNSQMSQPEYSSHS
ncbi:MAG: DUF3015 family protein, partial [Pseudobdellovibrionaceae bacterium]